MGCPALPWMLLCLGSLMLLCAELCERQKRPCPCPQRCPDPGGRKTDNFRQPPAQCMSQVFSGRPKRQEWARWPGALRGLAAGVWVRGLLWESS